MCTNKLIHCVHCGHIVSRQAEYCPQCRKEDFMGRECIFCKTRDQKYNLIELYSPYTRTQLADFYAHEHCLNRILHVNSVDHATLFCRDCETAIPKEEVRYHLFKSYHPYQNHRIICSNCGSTPAISHLTKECYFCGSTILKGFHEYETIKVKTRWYDSRRIREVSLHTDCLYELEPSIIAEDKSIFIKRFKRLKRGARKHAFG
jgi:hypothetical protein